MDKKTYLLDLKHIREHSYSPYSNFKVGSLVIDKDGDKFYGVNVENASYGLTECAERNAITSAVTQKGKIDIDTIFVLGADYTTPCGACRQIIQEFATKDTKVILLNNKLEEKTFHFNDLLPYSFILDNE